MKPEVVLKLDPTDKLTDVAVKSVRDEWIKEYQKHIEWSTLNEELGTLLIDRINRAAELCIRRFVPDKNKSVRIGPADCDPAFYEMKYEEELRENDALDGDFPLGNAYDADFAVPYFSIEQLVYIQFGETHLLSDGYYMEPAHDKWVRKGFLTELQGDWTKAEQCYGHAAKHDQNVAKRQEDCRNKKVSEGERCYAEAQKYMESGEWSKIYPLLSRASDMENSDAMVDMALGYAYGTMGFPQYFGDALELLRKAANKYNNARACMELVEFHDNGSFDITGQEAKRLCEKAAEAGDKKAIARLPDGFDLRPMKEILAEQVAKGNIDALWMLYNDALKRYCRDEARMWYEKAIEAGQVDALIAEADKYLSGFGSLNNLELAERYLRRAADKGSITAILKLGTMQLYESDDDFWNTAVKTTADDFSVDEELKARHRQQFAWYKLAAEAGHTEAMNDISVAYYYGYPVDENEKEAFKWASASAEQNDAYGKYLTAYFLEGGNGCDKNIDRAIELYIMAAEKGIVPSMLRLHEIYRDGLEHIAPDKEKAARYLWMSGIGHT